MIDLLCLLEFYNTYAHDDIFHSISEKLLNNFEEIGKLNMQELADYLFISTSTLYRFIKMLSYNNHGEMRCSWQMFLEQYMSAGRYLPCHRSTDNTLKNYGDYLAQRLHQIADEIDENRLVKITQLLLKHEEIIFVGMPMPSAIWRLQIELVLLGKKTSAFLNPQYQQKAVSQAGKNALVFMVQYIPENTSFYLNIAQEAHANGMTTAAISNIPISPTLEYIDCPIAFQGDILESDLILVDTIINTIGNNLNNHILKTRKHT